jgi:maltodextrin utilization protein YvdJ
VLSLDVEAQVLVRYRPTGSLLQIISTKLEQFIKHSFYRRKRTFVSGRIVLAISGFYCIVEELRMLSALTSFA